MPISKRQKKVSLTKVKKRSPPQARASYVDTVRTAVEQTVGSSADGCATELRRAARRAGAKAVCISADGCTAELRRAASLNLGLGTRKPTRRIAKRGRNAKVVSVVRDEGVRGRRRGAFRAAVEVDGKHNDKQAAKGGPDNNGNARGR